MALTHVADRCIEDDSLKEQFRRWRDVERRTVRDSNFIDKDLKPRDPLLYLDHDEAKRLAPHYVSHLSSQKKSIHAIKFSNGSVYMRPYPKRGDQRTSKSDPSTQHGFMDTELRALKRFIKELECPTNGNKSSQRETSQADGKMKVEDAEQAKDDIVVKPFRDDQLSRYNSNRESGKYMKNSKLMPDSFVGAGVRSSCLSNLSKCNFVFQCVVRHVSVLYDMM